MALSGYPQKYKLVHLKPYKYITMAIGSKSLLASCEQIEREATAEESSKKETTNEFTRQTLIYRTRYFTGVNTFSSLKYGGKKNMEGKN